VQIFSHLANCNPYIDQLFTEIDGEVVGYVRQWAEERLSKIKAALPPVGSNISQVGVSQAQTGSIAILEKADYQAVRYFYHMLHPNLDEIHCLPLPEGLKIRPTEPARYPTIWESIGEPPTRIMP
jgi:hypothetical protein